MKVKIVLLADHTESVEDAFVSRDFSVKVAEYLFKLLVHILRIS